MNFNIKTFGLFHLEDSRRIKEFLKNCRLEMDKRTSYRIATPDDTAPVTTLYQSKAGKKGYRMIVLRNSYDFST